MLLPHEKKAKRECEIATHKKRFPKMKLMVLNT